MPKRIQRKRTKGWKMPPNAVYVGRPSFFGNMFTHADPSVAVAAFRRVWTASQWFAHYHDGLVDVDEFRNLKRVGPWPEWWWHKELVRLRGKDLVCWCGDGPCHADVLLELANA
jgi:hypothetical protein